MQHELKAIQQRVGITFIYVTHDQEEALTMSDTIVVMDQGKIQQIGTPVDIYNEPVNSFVADFIGESNIIDGIMIKDLLVKFSGKEFVCLDKGFEEMENVEIVVRPEDVEITSPEKGMLVGEVKSVVFMGVHYEMIVDVDNYEYLIHSTRYSEVGEKVGLILEPDSIHIMKAGK